MSFIAPRNTTPLYREAGVDIEEGEAFVKALAPFTGSTSSKGAACELGGFGGVFDIKATGYKDPLLIASTDGVGTKLLLAIQANQLDGLGQDLVAMCANDIVAQGAKPLFFLDYLACGKLEQARHTNLIKGISEACASIGCALIGGETAEMPRLYRAKDFDLAGFALGAVEREQLLPNSEAQADDVVLGLASDGVHANGFSLVHKILEANSDLSNDKEFIAELLTPTRLYVKSVLAVLRDNNAVRGIAHITGGGLVNNLPRALTDPKNLTIEVDYSSWQMPALFARLQEAGGITAEEMHTVFNCGIGMALIVAKNEAEQIGAQLESLGEKVFAIGRVRKG